MEQISMFEEQKKSKCQIFYDKVSELLRASGRSELNLQLHSRKAYDTIEIGDYSSACIRMKFGAKKQYFSVPSRYKTLVDVANYTMDSSGNWIKIDINSPEDITLYRELLYKVYDHKLLDTSPDSFDCCSRYKECSNEKKCVNPYADIRKYCKYRQKIVNGIIFYGINRTLK